MPDTAVNQIIDKIYPTMSLNARNAIQRLCKDENQEAGTIFIKKGDWDKYEYFLVSGVVRSYLENNEGEEITLSFFEQNSVISPHLTRTKNERALINYQALTSCKLQKINASNFAKLIETDAEVREFAHEVLKRELQQKVNKEIQLASWTANERLQQFRKDFHMLENLIPHPMIAAYLGITNVSLSRLRKSL